MRLSDQDISRYFQARLGAPDSQPLFGTSIEDLATKALQVFKQLRKLETLDAPELDYDEKELLQAHNLLAKDKRSLTTAALLLFGKEREIKRYFPALRLDIIRIQGTEWGKDKDPFLSRDLQGNLLSLRSPAMDFLERFFLDPFHADQKGDRISENAHRKALREALTNLLMHMNYYHPSPSQVRIYNDRVEFYNPGYSLKYPSLYNMPGSELRNPSIASVFYDLGWAEAKGTGLKTMEKQLKNEGLPGPEYLNDMKNDTFTFILRHQFPGIPGAGTDQVTDQVALTVDRRALTLEYCRNPKTLKEIMNHLGVRHKPHFVDQILRPLMVKGLIVMTIPEKPNSRMQKYVTAGRE